MKEKGGGSCSGGRGMGRGQAGSASCRSSSGRGPRSGGGGKSYETAPAAKEAVPVKP